MRSGLAACQAGDRRPAPRSPVPCHRPQEHHIALCLGAYLMVEHERLGTGRRGARPSAASSSKGTQGGLPALERVRKAA